MCLPCVRVASTLCLPAPRVRSLCSLYLAHPCPRPASRLDLLRLRRCHFPNGQQPGLSHRCRWLCCQPPELLCRQRWLCSGPPELFFRAVGLLKCFGLDSCAVDLQVGPLNCPVTNYRAVGPLNCSVLHSCAVNLCAGPLNCFWSSSVFCKLFVLDNYTEM